MATKKKVAKKAETKENPGMYVPTGSTLLNLACSNKADRGYKTGKIINIVGDSSTGKTLLALTSFAEMGVDPRFDDYRFIFDDAEAALEFDLEKLFGKKTNERIETPHKNGESSTTIEELSIGVMRAIKEGKPFVYILDSLDALSTNEEKARASELTESGEEKQSYKMEKAKKAGELLRIIASDIKKTNSLVIIISQTRDNVGAKPWESKKRKSGGNAWKFYMSHEMWLVSGGKLKKKVRKKDREYGVKAVCKLTKNKTTGFLSIIDFPILYYYGVDDITSCVEYLLAEGHWVKDGNIKIAAEEFGQTIGIKPLVRWIEDNDKEDELKQIVENVWFDIQSAIRDDDRKKKF